ncbi:TetR/AcrR family transcriptional regulator [Paenibacillus sp. NPDC058071]|uniref:TetR/AcrR family transcriptional regulator n=1 Tax=Paenibacillus sp. NPDC058071 TaxID=3346326 RepID=UPI0036DE21F6
MSHVLNSNDPRVVRTRQLILDAFVALLNKRDFNDITVSDITKQATVNRATFYAHFADKYALLDTLLSDTFMEYVQNRVDTNSKFSHDMLKNVIMALCDYHANSSSQIARHYESAAPVVEANIKLQIEQFVTRSLGQSYPAPDPTSHMVITMVSWAIYGITYRWNCQGQKESPEELADRALPIMLTEGATMLELSRQVVDSDDEYRAACDRIPVQL